MFLIHVHCKFVTYITVRTTFNLIQGLQAHDRFFALTVRIVEVVKVSTVYYTTVRTKKKYSRSPQ